MKSKNENDEYIDYKSIQWKIVDSYFEEKKGIKLIKHQICSYDDFIQNRIPEIIKSFNPISIFHDYQEEHNLYLKEMSIEFDNIYISKPTIHENNGSTKIMTPAEARLRNFTYCSHLYVDIKININERQLDNLNNFEKRTKYLKKINIGKIPIMVKSKYCVLYNDEFIKMDNQECKYDNGGYFIINGSEKILISQERQAENKPYAFANIKQNSRYSHTVEIKSTKSNTIGNVKTINVKILNKPNEFGKTIRVTFPHIKQDIPIFIIFRALGIESDKEIIKYILLDDINKPHIKIYLDIFG